MLVSPLAQLTGWLIAVGFSVPIPSTARPAGGLELHAVEQGIVAATNAERRRHGLSPLLVDPLLVRSARAHTAWMTRSQSLQHTMAAVAENIAVGQRTASEVLRDWMGSPGHRANILSGAHRRLGVAAYTAPGGAVYWCQQFLP